MCLEFGSEAIHKACRELGSVGTTRSAKFGQKVFIKHVNLGRAAELESWSGIGRSFRWSR
jgi:hypothetical protein